MGTQEITSMKFTIVLVLVCVALVAGSKGVQFYSFDHSEFDVFELERYDIEKGFAIASKNKSHCYEQGLTGSMPNPFSWIAQAKYKGVRSYRHIEYDEWEYKNAGIKLRIIVEQADNTSPVLYEFEKSNGDETDIFFKKFEAKIPNDDLFQIPSQCAK